MVLNRGSKGREISNVEQGMSNVEVEFLIDYQYVKKFDKVLYGEIVALLVGITNLE
jgi:hypothetical protein